MSTEIGVEVVPFEKVFSNPNVYECPFFQRPFKWTKKNIDKFVSDLIQLEVDDDDTVEHYLGAIVVRRDLGAPSGLQHPTVWTVIDGQQRLTTTFLTVLALCELLHAAGVENDDEALRERAAAYVSQYLMLDPTWPRGREPRVLPTMRDYSDLLGVIAATRGRARVPDESPDRFRFADDFIPEHGEVGGLLAKAHGTTIPKALKEQLRDSVADPDVLERVLTNLLRRMKVIWVSVPPDADPYEIFHNLNAEGQRLSHSELVKVVVFRRYDRSDVAGAESAEQAWDGIVDLLGPDAFEAFLFPYALCHDPQAKKRELIPALEDMWKRWTPAEILVDLTEYAHLYRLITDANAEIADEVADARLAERVRAMRESAPPSSAYPYLMLTLKQALADPSFVDEACRIFWSVEAFLVRRQYEGIEPTGLHALFKSLWTWEDEGVTGQTAAGFRNRVADNVNIRWVTDDEFRKAVTTSPLYGRRIQRFVISEFERSHFGDISADALASMEIDHVAPQFIEGTEWESVFGNPETYEALVNTWGNLIPLVKEGDASNSAKGRKNWNEARDILSHSIFQTPKELCKEPAWDEYAIQRRNQAVAEWALRRWPDTPPASLPKKPKDIAASSGAAPPSQPKSKKQAAPIVEPVEDLIAVGESARVEFKSSLRAPVGGEAIKTPEHEESIRSALQHAVLKTVCGFLNGEGGTLLIGVEDDGNALGLGPDLATFTVENRNTDKYELALRDMLEAGLSAPTALTVQIDFPAVGDVVVCRVAVSASTGPVYARPLKGSGKTEPTDFWVRVGNATRQLQGSDADDYRAGRW
jgi:hypothetical protein